MIGVALAAAITGVISGLAIGGGSLLVPALVFIFGVVQHTAQGVVLLSFIPVAAVAVTMHYHHGFVRLSAVYKLVPAAMIGGITGAALASQVPAELLRRIFGAYLLIMSAYTFLAPGPGSRVNGDEDDKS